MGARSGPSVLMLSLSSDLAEARDGLNEAQARQASYAASCRDVHVVVRTAATASGQPLRIDDNLTVEPTGTRTRLAGFVEMIRRARRILRAKGTDLIVAQDPFATGLIGLMLGRWYRRPLCVHYLCDFIDNPHWLRERRANRLLNRVGRLVLRRARMVRTDSPDEVEKLVALGVPSARIRYIPFLQEGLDRFRTAVRDESLRRDLLGTDGDALALWVGRLEPQKGIDTLVEVAARVHRARPGVRFAVVGDGSRRAELEASLARAGLRDVVRLLGWVDFAALPAYFASADLFLATSRYETAARVLVLARAAGLPVVTTAVSGAPDLAQERHGGGLAAIDDVAELSRLVLARLATLEVVRRATATARDATIAPFERTSILSEVSALYRATTASEGASRPSLCFVLPEYDADTDEHFLHTYRLLDELSRHTRLTVIVERARTAPALRAANVWTQRWTHVLPLRLVEITAMCLRLRREGCTHFYVHYSYFGVVAAWIVTRVLGGRVFYWHCVSEVFRKRGLGREAFRHRLNAELPLRLSMRLVDRVVTGTATLREFYARTFDLPAERILVVPNDIDASQFARGSDVVSLRTELGISPSEQVVLFVHRIARRKGVHHLPAIVREVVRQVPRTRFVIVGDGPELVALSQMVEEDAILRRHVILTGKVPNRVVPDYFALADAFVMPSEEEGFPRVLLEAMAAGVPFVASDVGGVRELCAPAQHWGLAGIGDRDAIATKLVALLGNADLRWRLVAAGKRQVRQFAVDRVARMTLQALDLGTVAAESPSPDEVDDMPQASMRAAIPVA